MYLEIISPESTIFQGNIMSVLVPGVNGEFEMLNNHAPIISNLKEGFIKIKGNLELDEEVNSLFEKKEKSYWLKISSGTVEINNNKVIVLIN
tara:strand:+ start:255 stop:530 length:276 start_codon:yes stop_codon:yes gene_type:complete